MEFQSLNKLFLDRAEENSNNPFLWSKISKEWKSLTWNETLGKVKEFSSGLKSHGIKPGDRIVIVSENRPEWIIADLAITLLGGITVPCLLYTSPSPRD